MSKIKNIEELRDFTLRTIDKLEAGEINTTDAMAAAKLTESVIVTVKSEMDYARLTGIETSIPFMQKNVNLLEQDKPNLLELPRRKGHY